MIDQITRARLCAKIRFIEGRIMFNPSDNERKRLIQDCALIRLQVDAQDGTDEYNISASATFLIEVLGGIV